MDLAWLALLYIGGGMLLSLIGLATVRKFVPITALQAHHDVAGFVYAVLGTIYAVLLAFLVIVLWGQRTEAEDIAEREADDLTVLLHLSFSLPLNQRQQFVYELGAYLTRVTQIDLPRMKQGLPVEIDPPELDAMWRQTRTMDLQTGRDQIIYDKVVSQLTDLTINRRRRMLAARREIPAVMYYSIAAGTVLTIGFSYLFGLKNLASQIAVTVALTGMVTINLFLIASLQHPFAGSMRVSSEAFYRVLRHHKDLESQ